MGKNETNEIAEAINWLAETLENSDLHGPNKMCGMIGVSMTESIYLLAQNIGRIADVMEKQSKQN